MRNGPCTDAGDDSHDTNPAYPPASLLPHLTSPRHSLDDEDSPEALDRVIKFTWVTGGTLTLVLLILWPILALPAKVFSEGYFTFWVIIAMIWGIVAATICIVLPIFEAKDMILMVLSGKKHSSHSAAEESVQAKSAHMTLPPAQANRA